MTIYILTVNGGVRGSYSTYQKAKSAAIAYTAKLIPLASIEWSTPGFEALISSKDSNKSVQIIGTTLDQSL